MLNTIWGVVRNGKVEPAEQTNLPEGARVLLTVMQDEDVIFWRRLSEESLKSVWDNSEDDVYAALLKRCCRPGPLYVL
jgi:hypothetical protein